jgi:polar amino acid transport system substrate-binding protein
MRAVRVRGLVLAALMVGAGTAARAECDITYATVAGDTIFTIAERHYADAEKWTLIYYANQGVTVEAMQNPQPGTELFIPCPVNDPKPDATPLRQPDAEMRLLTGSNYAPFTDRAWPGEGLITELVNAILEETPAPVPFAIEWEDDWSQHLFPRLDGIQADMGFPWLRPDCAADPANERCANFHFSDPLFEMPIQLFVRAGAGFDFTSDADIPGHTLCRPKGYYTHDLDGQGRNWIRDGLVTLKQPATPDDCFRMLMAGEVDAVPENLFLGAEKIRAMGLRGQIVPLDRQLSSETLHVIISKKHWRGTTHLYRINAGLAAIRASGRYSEIVNRHLGLFMENLKK